MTTSLGRRVVVIDGRRTPFCRSLSDYEDLTAYDLGREAVAGLLHATRVDPDAVDLLVMGRVLADPRTTNLGREVVLGTQLPDSVPAYTVTMACVSSLQSFVDCARAIMTGAADVAIAAGAETLSDAPIRFRRSIRKRLMHLQKARSFGDRLRLLKGLGLSDLLPEPVAIAEFSTGEVMGENGERLAKRLGISREAQDGFALESHRRARWATDEGLLARQLTPVFVKGARQPVTEDNGIRVGEPAQLARLRPAFDRRFGTLTAANSSYLTDGASAVLLASEEAADRLGLEPLAVLRATSTAALDPLEELLLGPALVLPRALESAGLELENCGVVELHEAFAAQVLAVLELLDDEAWCRQRLGRDRPLGRIDPARLNAWGGSLSVGHPFGATGARLVVNAVHRMRHEESRYGVVAACAAGALGIGLVFERV